MKSVIVVEPNNLARSGILQILQESSLEIICKGIDYSQLFSTSADDTPCDLMLLAAPDIFDQAAQLINAAVRAYAPQRVLLLSEASTLHYSLQSLPVVPAGHLSKYSPSTVLTAAVSLVLAGGQCFPPPSNTDNRRASDTAQMGHTRTSHPRRRWYDKPTPSEPATAVHADNPTAQEPVSQADKDCKLLGITRRQLEILILLAKGESIKSISRQLKISVSTVKTHADALYQRLSVHSRTAAIYEATSRGANLGLGEPDTTGQRGS